MNTNISLFTVDADGPNLPIKRQQFSDWMEKFTRTLFMSDTPKFCIDTELLNEEGIGENISGK